MSELFSIWEGPDEKTILYISEYLNRTIPEYVKISNNLNEDSIFALARNFEEYISSLLQNNKNIVNVDNALYYSGDIKKFELKILIKTGETWVFPDAFFISEGINDFIKSREDSEVDLLLEKF